MNELPADIKKVWGNTPEDEQTARALLNEWGEDVFRSSAIHRQAVLESDREAKMEPIRKAFIAAKKKEKK